MPCVCLSNTFRHWQALKTLCAVQAQSATPATYAATDRVDVAATTSSHPTRAQDFAETLYIAHPHKPLAAPVLDSEQADPGQSLALSLPLSFNFATKPSRADLINAESRLGSSIFGPIPAGHRREFFHDRKNVWIWHEDWQDAAQQPRQLTVRYEVRTSGVYKKVAAGKYLKLEGDELSNFRRATRAYLYLVKKYLYQTPQVQSDSF